MRLTWVFGGSRQGDVLGLLRRVAEKGYAPAQTNLAMLIDDNNAERVPLLEKAAAQNDCNALFYLGHWWEQVENGKEKAIELYRKASELNHRKAQFEYRLSAFGTMCTGNVGKSQ
jgi:ABC-type antimicrobial peptide transport system ATPase subunit